MLALMALTSLAAFLFVYIFMPGLWLSIMSFDESLNSHDSGLALVASRNPFRETGPPANMAKLILLRHKIQTNRKRRSASLSRPAPRSYRIPSRSKAKSSWMRFGKPIGGKQHH